MTSLPDHYAALGIDPTADQEVITAAYRALAKKYHPDTGATAGTASPERFEQIQQAYEVLRTPASRHRYDLELLAETERELAAHLAAKRRIVPYGAAPQPSAAPPPPDLGQIRPEPPPRPAQRPKPKQPIAPFLVPVALLLAIAGGGAWLLLPSAPEAPPLPRSAAPDQAAVTPKPTAPGAAAPKPAAQQPAVAAPEPAPAERPLFGSMAMEQAEPARQASAAPAPQPAAATPVFGSSIDDVPAAAAPEAPPVPKPRPASATRPARPQAAPAAQPGTRVQRQATAPEPVPQPRRVLEQGPYRLVIFQRPPGGETTAWSAGLVFDTQGSCTQFGVKAVLRRKANRPPGMAPGDIWYECQPR